MGCEGTGVRKKLKAEWVGTVDSVSISWSDDRGFGSARLCGWGEGGEDGEVREGARVGGRRECSTDACSWES